MTSDNDQATKKNFDKDTGISMGLGIALGIALGSALGNVAVGLVSGVAVGGAGVAIRKRQAKKRGIRLAYFQECLFPDIKQVMIFQ
jgi:hypothetical protein